MLKYGLDPELRSWIRNKSFRIDITAWDSTQETFRPTGFHVRTYTVVVRFWFAPSGMGYSIPYLAHPRARLQLANHNAFHLQDPD